jgi:hypothetical protein
VLSTLFLPGTALAESPKVLFILDGSGSMNAQVEGKPKIEVARKVMGGLINTLPADVSVGLETYGHTRKDDCNDIEMLVPVGGDRSAIERAVNQVNPKGSTPLTGAIRMATTKLREVEGSASVVVVSDGKETCGGDPCAAVRDAVAQGMKMQVHVVGFDVTADEAEQLRCIAKEGKGKYFAAANAQELGTALAQVREEVVQLAPPTPPKEGKKPTAFGVGTLDFQWPGRDCWRAFRGETEVAYSCGGAKKALQSGTYTVKADGNVFEPFSLTIENGATKTIQMGGTFDFQWPGRDCWRVFRGETETAYSCGGAKKALQSGTYTVKADGNVFEPFTITIEDGGTTTVP